MELGIRRNLGVLYIDRHGANRREVPTMLEHLARFFQVSKTVVRIRLTELNLLMEQPGSGPQSAAQILRKMVRGDA
jgi:Zn-dependent peptidase ImmA (M78 family)